MMIHLVLFVSNDVGILFLYFSIVLYIFELKSNSKFVSKTVIDNQKLKLRLNKLSLNKNKY